tara:strand:+ start:7668 stop:8519 length:852 start_codon:yes stop_codon:yes gene_type:complete
MENLTHYQESVLDKLLPPLTKTNPNDELVRISVLYNYLLKDEKDEYLLNRFRIQIESNLSSVINRDYRYQELTEYKEEHLLRVEGYIKDFYDTSTWDGIDGIKELTKDYLEECISEQNTIIEKTIKHLVPIPDRDSLNVMQFVSDEFLDEYKPSSKRKINFLNEELNQLKGFPKPIEAVGRKEYNNPHPELFISVDTYCKFKEYTSLHIIDFMSDYSYLFKTLKSLRLIHNCTEKEFMLMVYEEMELISKKTYDKFMVIGRLKSLKNSSSESRLNNFNNIFLD